MNTLQKTKLRGTGINCGLIVLLFAVVLLLGQVLPENTYRRVLVPIIWQMCIFILLGTSLNLTLGFLGQLTLGHMGFAGVGAYTAALTSLALERAGLFEASKAAPGQLILVILGCCLLGAIFAGLLGLLVGIPALRLHGDYLAIVTLGFGLIVENVIANLPFAGGDGLTNGTASSSLYANGLGLSTSLQAKYVWLVLGITILCIAIMCMFIRSKYGRAIEAIRDDEIAASASGVNTTYYKILTFVISAFFAGLAGGLYATCFSSLTTASFTFTSAYLEFDVHRRHRGPWRHGLHDRFGAGRHCHVPAQLRDQKRRVGIGTAGLRADAVPVPDADLCACAAGHHHFPSQRDSGYLRVLARPAAV